MQQKIPAFCRDLHPSLPLLFLPVDHPVETGQCVIEAAQPVNEPHGHRLFPVHHTAHIRGQLVTGQHQPGKLLPVNPGILADKVYDLLLNPLEIPIGLGRTDDRAGWMVMEAVGTIMDFLAHTASGTPME